MLKTTFGSSGKGVRYDSGSSRPQGMARHGQGDGQEQQRLNWQPLNVTEMYWMRQMLRESAVAVKCRKAFYERYLSRGVMLKLGKNYEPSEYMQRLLDHHLLRCLKDAFDWELIIGVVPYSYREDSETNERLPVIPALESGLIYTAYDYKDNTQHFLWRPQPPQAEYRGAGNPHMKLQHDGSRNVEELADKKMRFFVFAGRQPDIFGNLRADLRNAVQKYVTVKQLEDLALKLEEAKLRPPKIIETQLPNNPEMMKGLKDIITINTKFASTRELNNISLMSQAERARRGMPSSQYLDFDRSLAGQPVVNHPSAGVATAALPQQVPVGAANGAMGLSYQSMVAMDRIMNVHRTGMQSSGLNITVSGPNPLAQPASMMGQPASAAYSSQTSHVDMMGTDRVLDNSTGVEREMWLPPLKHVTPITLQQARNDIIQMWEFINNLLSSVLDVGSGGTGGTNKGGGQTKNAQQTVSSDNWSSIGMASRGSMYEQMALEIYWYVWGDTHKEFTEQFIEEYTQRQLELEENRKQLEVYREEKRKWQEELKEAKRELFHAKRDYSRRKRARTSGEESASSSAATQQQPEEGESQRKKQKRSKDDNGGNDTDDEEEEDKSNKRNQDKDDEEDSDDGQDSEDEMLNERERHIIELQARIKAVDVRRIASQFLDIELELIRSDLVPGEQLSFMMELFNAGGIDPKHINKVLSAELGIPVEFKDRPKTEQELQGEERKHQTQMQKEQVGQQLTLNEQQHRHAMALEREKQKGKPAASSSK